MAIMLNATVAVEEEDDYVTVRILSYLLSRVEFWRNLDILGHTEFVVLWVFLLFE